MEEVLKILEQREQKTPLRTKSKERVKKAKKPTKKEQQIYDIEAALTLPANYCLINTPELFVKFIEDWKSYSVMFKEPFVYVDTETYGVDNFKDPIISISIGFDNNQYFNIPLRPFKHQLSRDVPTLDFNYVVNGIKPQLENSTWLVLANSKFDIHELFNWCGIDITFNIFWDTVIAGGLLNENKSKGLKEWYKNSVLPKLIESRLIEDETATPTFKYGTLFDKIPFDEVPHRLATYYACHDVYMTQQVFKYQKSIFENPAYSLERVYKLFREIEMPLIPIFTIAERRGVELDSQFLRDTIGELLKQKLQEILRGKKDDSGNEIVKGIFSYLGDTVKLTKFKTRTKQGIKYKEEYVVEEELNMGSPKQLVQKLYQEHKILEPIMEYDKTVKMKVPKCKTDKKTLTRNKRAHPVIPLILEYRGLSKLIDAFTEKLPNNTVEGKIHCSYNQLVRTGRVSCSSPNLQQIPSKFDVIRYAFRASEGRLLASIDFSQHVASKNHIICEKTVKTLQFHCFFANFRFLEATGTSLAGSFYTRPRPY